MAYPSWLAWLEPIVNTILIVFAVLVAIVVILFFILKKKLDNQISDKIVQSRNDLTPAQISAMDDWLGFVKGKLKIVRKEKKKIRKQTKEKGSFLKLFKKETRTNEFQKRKRDFLERAAARYDEARCLKMVRKKENKAELRCANAKYNPVDGDKWVKYSNISG